MNISQHCFDTDIVIFNIGDVHRGDEGCNTKLFYKVIAEVQRMDNARWVSTGDLLNVALKTSKSDCYKSKPLGQEMKLLEEELKPIASKCLGLVESNHHRRFDLLTGMSLDEQICGRLNIPFLGKLGILNVTCERNTYFIVMHHGTGAGKKRGSKTNSTEALGELIPAADVYMEGHTHSFDHFVDETSYIDRKRGSLVCQESTFVVTGHFLNWEESYAMDMKLPSRPKGSAVIELTASNQGKRSSKKIRVDLFR